jgi:hypothetical protein
VGFVKIFGPDFANVGPGRFPREYVAVSEGVGWGLLEWVEGPAAERPGCFARLGSGIRR